MSRDPVRLHNAAIGTIACCGIATLALSMISVPLCANWLSLQQPNRNAEGDRYRQPTELPAGADAEGYLPGEEVVPYR